MNHNHRIRSATRVVVLGMVTATLWAAGSFSPARACSTPVFRYAMYNWQPAPYYVFYFHHGQVAKEDEAVNKLLDELAHSDPPANVVLATVDVSKQEEFERLPRVVKKIYRSHAEGQQPLHVVFSPWVMMYAWYAEQYARASEQREAQEETPEGTRPGTAEETAGPSDQDDSDQPKTPDKTAGSPDKDEGDQPEEQFPGLIELFAGRLDKKTVEAMVDSPVRQQIGKLLEEGNASVLLILTGPDKDANVQAEKAVAEVVTMATKGEFGVPGGDDYPLDQLPSEAPDDAPAEDTQGDPRQEDSSDVLKLALLKLSRTDPAEKWLVDTLLSIEPDLREEQFAKSPMVFAVYGRGRALPPFVGKGITAENLAECVMFLSGPCSCTVRDQNPGCDLLVRRDWDAAAEALAANDPEFNAGPWGYQEFEPDDSGESGDETQASAADAQGDTTPPAGDPEPKVDQPPVAGQTDTQPEAADSQLLQKRRPQRLAKSLPAQAPADDKARSGGRTESFGLRQTWTIGIGLGLGAALVLVAGVVLILRQRP
ncbi:MAG: hypothetical protein ACYSWU_16470 [Planctomycetota bacterium]|jgi:hypothetical protein